MSGTSCRKEAYVHRMLVMCCNDRSCRCSRSCWFSTDARFSADAKMLVNRIHEDRDADTQHGCYSEVPDVHCAIKVWHSPTAAVLGTSMHALCAVSWLNIQSHSHRDTLKQLQQISVITWSSCASCVLCQQEA